MFSGPGVAYTESAEERSGLEDCRAKSGPDIEDLRMSLRLLAKCQIGHTPVIDLTAEEKPVVGNEEDVVPIEELVDLDEETVVEGIRIWFRYFVGLRIDLFVSLSGWCEE